MRVKILVPAGVVADIPGADKVSAEALNGSFTMLPRHIDFVTELVPGILDCVVNGAERIFAVDGGILVKAGSEVTVSAQNAVEGPALGQLRGVIAKQFEAIDENERKARAAFEKLEAGFVRGIVSRAKSDQ